MGTNPNPPIQGLSQQPGQVLGDGDCAPAYSLAEMLVFLTQHAYTNAAIYDLIYEKVDQSRFAQLIARAELVKNAIRPKTSKQKPGAWRTRQSVLRGKLFEQIVGLFLRASKPFQAYNRIISPTNELDWLVVFGPLQNTVPAFREWGPHFVCECKFSQQNVKSEWVGKLATLLQTHGAKVALLVAHKVLKGSNGQARQAQQLTYDLCLLGRFILSVSFDDLSDCVASNQNFLHMLNIRYSELTARASKLRLLLN